MLLGDLQPLIANALGDTTTAAYIEGAAASVEKVGVPVVAPAKISPADLSFIEVEFPAAKASARSLVSKKVYTPKEFKALNNASRARAFTAAGEITDEARTRLRDRLGEMAEQGADRKAFVAEMDALPLSEPHLEQIFRNNIRTAFSEGQEEVLDQPGVGEAFVYRRYDAIRDDRVRPEHLALETSGIQGTNIYHKDDPVWKAFRPPWDFNCRCDWTAISIRQAAAKGIKSAQESVKTGKPPKRDFVPKPPFKPDPQWQRSAGEEIT